MPQLMVQQPPPSAAQRDDGKRFVVHADELLTAFLELASATRAAEGSKDCGGREITLDKLLRIK